MNLILWNITKVSEAGFVLRSASIKADTENGEGNEKKSIDLE